jgi:hypothetical protein
MYSHEYITLYTILLLTPLDYRRLRLTIVNYRRLRLEFTFHVSNSMNTQPLH